MKPGALIVFLVAAITAQAAPPSDVAGMKFWRSYPGFSLFDGNGTELLLNADGTYTGLRSFLWREGRSGVGAGGPVLISVLEDISIPGNGVWSYRVVDQTTAEMVVDDRIIRLRFTDGDRAGYIDEQISGKVLVPIFSFAGYDASTRLSNCSTRSFVAPGRTVTLGFVITTGERRVLVRAVGPGLRSFGVSEPLQNPRLNVYPARSGLPVDFSLPATSRTTLDLAAQRVGAFPLPSANDTGKFLTLTQGAYIVEVAAADRVSTGEVLVEVYQLP